MLSMKQAEHVTQLGLFNEIGNKAFQNVAAKVLEEVVSNAGKQEYSAVTIGYLLSAPLAKQIIVNYYDLKSYYDMQKPLTGGISYLFENVKGTQIKFTGLNIYNAHDYLQTYTQVLNKKGIKYDWADYNKLTILVD
jgi:hypothetical protein